MAMQRNPPSLQKDSSLIGLDSRTYGTNLTKAFCVGTVPNGGYVGTIFLRAASLYLGTRRQEHTITAHWEFLRRTEAGPAVLCIEDAKLGRAMSVLHVSLYQEGLLDSHPFISARSRKAVAAYIINGDLDGEAGVTLPTGWAAPLAPPSADLVALPLGKDPNWKSLDMPIMQRVPMLSNLEYYCLRSGHPLPATQDLWIRMANGEKFTQADLGYVADAGPPLLVEAYRPKNRKESVPEGSIPYNKGFWFPTVVMNLDVKQKLPPGGVEWLRLRVVAKVINNGRYDAEVLVYDAKEVLIALSHHVALAIDIERNTAERNRLSEKI